MKAHRLQLKSGPSGPSRQGAGLFARIVVLTILVCLVWLFAVRSVTSIQKQSALLEFAYSHDGNEEGADSEDHAEEMMLQNSEIRQAQMSGILPNSTVIHVIHTRFMQHQPNLTELGLGRLLLFETFSLPTLLRQSSQNYLWIIRADPMLTDAVRQKFVELVQPYSNIYLIGSNDNPEGFRSSRYMADIQPDTIWSGDHDLLLQAHHAAQTRLVVETRLDADDGLYTDFVANIQQQAVKYLNDDNTFWKLWCSDVHVEWQLVSPWTDFDPEWGTLKNIESPVCVTPGLSVGYGLQAKRSDVPGGAHHLLHTQIPACESGNGYVKCLSRYPRSVFSAIRARTITSTAMGNVVLESMKSKVTNKKKKVERERVQEELWGYVVDLFGITKEMISSTRRSMKEKQSIIAAENLKGQCVKSFTCKKSSRAMLRMVAKNSKKKKTKVKTKKN